MNKKTLIVVGIIVILVIIVGVWAANRNGSNSMDDATTTMGTSSASTSSSGDTSSTSVAGTGSCEQKLAKQDFSVTKIYVGALAPVKYDQSNRTTQYDPETKTTAYDYRSAINVAEQGGVNYAGHYIVTTWGLGTGYQGSAVVDAMTGEIVKYGLKSNENLSYAASSTLLTTNPKKNFMEINRVDRLSYASRFTRDYYSIVNGKFTLLCSESATTGL